nr:ribosomal protein L3 [Cavernulicola chilensis]
MSIGMLGTKIGMTQIFDKNGSAVPVTVIQAGPCPVTEIKTLDKHGYSAIQVGYLNITSKTINKPLKRYFEKKDLSPLKYLKEYKITHASENTYKIGDLLTVENFSPAQLVNVSGITIGKGFSGYQKRHNFSRGPMSHGSKSHRTPGSIGAGTTPGRVIPGTRMAGQLGGKKVSINKLRIVEIDAENHILVLKGSIPGKSYSIVSVTLS